MIILKKIINIKEDLYNWYERKKGYCINNIIDSCNFFGINGIICIKFKYNNEKNNRRDYILPESVYEAHGDSRYWKASAKFFVDGNEYSGRVNVTSHKYIGEKIAILYNPKDPNDFISQSSTSVGISMIIFGCIFSIPVIKKLKNR